MLKKGFLLLFLLASFYIQAQEYRYFTLWNKNELSVELGKNLSLAVADRTHYVPKSNQFSVVLGQLSVKHEPKNWFGYGAAMRISYLHLGNSNWITENRPFVFIDLTKDLKEFVLSFSNRIEYRSYKELEDHFRHKQTLKLAFPSLAEWGMQFYLSEESFYKMNGAGTHRARFQSGLTTLDKDWFAMKLYYILEKSKVVDKWITGDIIGLNLSFSI